MDKHTRDEMDYIVSEAFDIDTIEDGIDMGYDPDDVAAGDKEALAEFMIMRIAAKHTY